MTNQREGHSETDLTYQFTVQLGQKLNQNYCKLTITYLLTNYTLINIIKSRLHYKKIY